MKQILKRILYFLFILALLVPVLSRDGLEEVKATSTYKINKTEAVLAKGKQLSLYLNNAEYATVTWSSENPKVATVDEKGRVTAVGKGSTMITATIKGVEIMDVSQLECEVGVKTADYIPETPEDFSYLAGKDIKAGQYVVFPEGTSSIGGFWEISNLNGDKVIDNEFVKKASVITIEKGQRLVIHRGYAIPISKVSKRLLGLYNQSIYQY